MQDRFNHVDALAGERGACFLREPTAWGSIDDHPAGGVCRPGDFHCRSDRVQIEAGRATHFHQDRHARFGRELLRGLVQAYQRMIGIVWPRVDGQHVFHRGYERAVRLRRDNPALSAMGLEDVFLSARPIVESLARSTMPSSTTLFSLRYAWNRPGQSAWLPSRRQKFVQPLASPVACGSTLPRSLPQLVASAPDKPSKRWCPKP